MSTDDEIRVRFTVTKDEALEYLDRHQRLTAAREAVVEAAKEWDMHYIEYELEDPIHGIPRLNLSAAVAALRAIEQETSNG